MELKGQITEFTRDLNWHLFLERRIQSIYSHLHPLTFLLKLYFHLYLGLQALWPKFWVNFHLSYVCYMWHSFHSRWHNHPSFWCKVTYDRQQNIYSATLTSCPRKPVHRNSLLHSILSYLSPLYTVTSCGNKIVVLLWSLTVLHVHLKLIFSFFTLLST